MLASREQTAHSSGVPWHWLPIGIFTVFTALNMMDRQLLAALAPTIKTEFHLSNAQYGLLISVFSAVIGLASPLAGLFLDHVGLRLGATVSILVWSIAGAATGWTRTLWGLIACRIGLGLGESGGGSTPGTVLAGYMNPAEMGIGAAALASGTSLGAIAAPLLVAALAPRYGWRFVFQVGGAIGLLWIPLWLVTAKLAPVRYHAARKERIPLRTLLFDRRLWGIAVAYALAKQTLWVAWTTVYFVQERHLTTIEANRQFSWYPPVFGIMGAFAVGALAMVWVRRGLDGMAARRKACWWIAPLTLLTAAVPFAPNPTTAAVVVGISFFASVCVWTSTHLMPLDLYGVGRAAFTYSILESLVTLLQTPMAPLVGSMIDRYGFQPVCMVMAMMPILGLSVLEFCLRGQRVLPLRPALAARPT